MRVSAQIGALAAVLLLGSCARAGSATSGLPSPSPSSIPAVSPAATPNPPSSSPEPSGSPQSPSTPPAPSVRCVAGLIPAYQALITGTGDTFLYDVTDPLRPRAVCRVSNAAARILTGASFEYLVPRADGTTAVMLHALGSNNESVVAIVKADLSHAYQGWSGGVAWVAGHDQLAYLADGGYDPTHGNITDVWLATTSSRTKIYSYTVAGRDAFGRPGFPPPTLGFSSDGAYLAAGWTASMNPVQVFRVFDGANVSPAIPPDFRYAFWSRSGQRLFLVSTAAVYAWTPGEAVTALPGAKGWTMQPSLSPNSSQVAFTDVLPNHEVRTYVYDLNSRSSRLLVDQPGSAALFVRAGWVWQVEEKPCVQSATNACFDPTQPEGRVLALDLATGGEAAVTFANGEGPTYFTISGGDVWPS